MGRAGRESWRWGEYNRRTMPLPILNQKGPSGPADLIRLFLKAEGLWCEHLAEAEALEAGTAFANPALPRIHDANNMSDVALPDGMSAQGAWEEAEAHFQAKGTTCWKWTMNPSAGLERTGPVVELLEGRGYVPSASEVHALDRSPQETIREVAGLRIIPARASFRHARQLMDRCATELWNEPQLGEAAMLHLDDPHYDALLALKGDEPVGAIGVLALGDVGRIEDVYVAPGHRNEGIGRTMMSRAMEICARSLFRVVLLGVDGGNGPALSLYRRFGFARVGEVISWRRPGL
jgi:ribosomal protein S18 acetylase RimI-like enzyme